MLIGEYWLGFIPVVPAPQVADGDSSEATPTE